MNSTSAAIPPRFQFSLSALLILTTVVAVALGLLGTVARQFVLFSIIQVAMGVVPAACLIGAIFARGSTQAFCLGALVPTAPILLIQGAYNFNVVAGDRDDWFWRTVGIWTAMQISALACGAVAVFVKRWIERHPDAKLPFFDR